MVSLIDATAVPIRPACPSTRSLRDLDSVRLCATAVRIWPALPSTQRLRDLTGAQRRASVRLLEARGARPRW